MRADRPGLLYTSSPSHDIACMHALQAVHIDEALERAQRFADIGADVLFIDALESAEEMRRFAADLPGAAARVPKMASMLEGGGKTPVLSQRELARMGFTLVAYPLSMLGVSVRAMQNALVVRARSPAPPMHASCWQQQRDFDYALACARRARCAVHPPPCVLAVIMVCDSGMHESPCLQVCTRCLGQPGCMHAHDARAIIHDY